MAELQNRITGVLGCKGSGKTTWASKRFSASPRALAFDSLGEYQRGLVVASSPGNKIYLCNYLERGKRFRVAFRPEAGADALQEDFNFFCRAAFAVGDVAVFIEEVDMYCGPNYAEEGLDRLVRYGRHKKVDLTYTSRRFPEIARGLTAQTDRYVLFRFAEPRDLKNIQDRWGAEMAERVSRLQNYESIEIDVREFSLAQKPVPELPAFDLTEKAIAEYGGEHEFQSHCTAGGFRDRDGVAGELGAKHVSPAVARRGRSEPRGRLGVARRGDSGRFLGSCARVQTFEYYSA